MNRLRIIPLDDMVVFPGMPVTLSVDVGSDDRVLLMPRQQNTYARVGVVAEVTERVRLAGRGLAVSLMPLHRAIPGGAAAEEDGVLRVDFEPRPDHAPPSSVTRELEREYRAVVDEILELRGDDGRIRAFVRSITDAGSLADTAGYSPDLNFTQKLQLLETFDVVERLTLALQFQRERLAELQVRKRIRDDVEDGAQKQQREYFLRRQMDAIRKELGENDGSIVDEYRQKIASAGMPEPVHQQAERELARLEGMGDSNAESAMIRTYLDWLLAVPWAKRSEERLDPVHAREVLDADHEGLDDVKRRITEYLAVRKLRAERGLTDDRRSGAILTLIGPPGTGKTSIGESIARATGRKFVRMSLGGVRDEAEIRGHRRTYIGALPGRLVRALRDAGTMNPVILLDEVDKIGADWRGDPSSALLEVLDPEQNNTFRDHYLDVPFDLSEVLFITTANILDPVPPPLKDRMEVLEIAGYTEEEKLKIATDHLVDKQIKNHGLTAEYIQFTPDALRRVIRGYTREAGVRNLEREIGSLCRKVARRRAEGNESPIEINPDAVVDMLGAPKFLDEEMEERTKYPGVAIGLAWTAVGGEVLFVEASRMAGTGSLTLTGQLGDVMKESARAALSWLRMHAKEYNIDPDFFKSAEIHIHVPSGAIPKDGPSAGVTMATAMASQLTGRPVRGDIAMTGEITLSGRVLPIGGVKEKVLAARRLGIHEVILPKQNAKNVNEDLTPELRKNLTVHLVSTIDEVLALALQPVSSDARPVKKHHKASGAIAARP